MSSSHEAVYWDSALHTLAGTGGAVTVTTYHIRFPQGTTKWRLINSSATISPEIAGSLATIALAGGPIPIPVAAAASTANVFDGSGQDLYVRNRTATPVVVMLYWERPGRLPSGMDAGTPTISGNLTP